MIDLIDILTKIKNNIKNISNIVNILMELKNTVSNKLPLETIKYEFQNGELISRSKINNVLYAIEKSLISLKNKIDNYTYIDITDKIRKIESNIINIEKSIYDKTPMISIDPEYNAAKIINITGNDIDTILSSNVLIANKNTITNAKTLSPDSISITYTIYLDTVVNCTEPRIVSIENGKIEITESIINKLNKILSLFDSASIKYELSDTLTNITKYIIKVEIQSKSTEQLAFIDIAIDKNLDILHIDTNDYLIIDDNETTSILNIYNINSNKIIILFNANNLYTMFNIPFRIMALKEKIYDIFTGELLSYNITLKDIPGYDVYILSSNGKLILKDNNGAYDGR